MDVDEFGELNEWEDRLDVLPGPAPWCVGDTDDEADPAVVDVDMGLLLSCWVMGSPPADGLTPETEVDAEWMLRML